MPYMYSEMQNKLSKTRESPLEPMGQIISSRCPYKVYSSKPCVGGVMRTISLHIESPRT